jgi:hypothetical protein
MSGVAQCTGGEGKFAWGKKTVEEPIVSLVEIMSEEMAGQDEVGLLS